VACRDFVGICHADSGHEGDFCPALWMAVIKSFSVR
jgi:hypothetical protein